MPNPSINSQWVKALNRTYSFEKPPPGFQTPVQIMQELNLKRTSVKALLRKLNNAGRLEIKKFYVQNQIGVYVPIPHYRIKKP